MNIKEKAKAKGYDVPALCEAFELKERQIYNILANPKQMHHYAVDGLPRKKKSAV